jgi:hypothetical integral membrane protein (TIGR02206 family)
MVSAAVSSVQAAEPFTPYGLSHLLVVVALAGGAVALVALGRASRGSREAERTGRILAVAVLVLLVPLQVNSMARSDAVLEQGLPLQLCDLAGLMAAYALWTRTPWAAAVTYYWGLSLTTQAVLTPDLSADFPDLVFLQFWGLHLLIVWTAAFLTWGLGIVPDWRGYRVTVAVSLGWMATVIAINAVVGSNYGYLNEKPGSASALDLLGPWPWYVLAEVAIALVAWALMTWPWVRKGRRSATAAATPPASSEPRARAARPAHRRRR